MNVLIIYLQVGLVVSNLAFTLDAKAMRKIIRGSVEDPDMSAVVDAVGEKATMISVAVGVAIGTTLLWPVVALKLTKNLIKK